MLSRTTHVPESERRSEPHSATVAALVIVWSAAEPHRVGELTLLPSTGEPSVLGRGEGGSGEARVRFFRQRPGAMDKTPPLASPGLSRRQLIAHPTREGVVLRRVGRCSLEVNGASCDEAMVVPGDVVALRRELILYCTRRPALIPSPRLFPAECAGFFGEADAFGILGESSGAWRLREAIAFAARSDTHTLIVGESGTGKELAARAVHALSNRSNGAFVARNAATLPPSLVDAELFGNARNYPNPGMAERAGLIGEADGGTLFLDEIGELPSDLQAHLLRVLDTGGEYQRLGEAKIRRSNVRLVAATNRDPSVLKHDFGARFTTLIEVPNLASRREDIPLLVRALLLRSAKRSPEIAGRFIATSERGYRWGRIHPAVMVHLLTRDFPANVRELDALLWRSLADSLGDEIELPPAARDESASPRRAPSVEPSSRREEIRHMAERLAEKLVLPQRPEPSVEAIRAELARSHGNVAQAARALGLSSRYALYRLMKKHRIESATRDDEVEP